MDNTFRDEDLKALAALLGRLSDAVKTNTELLGGLRALAADAEYKLQDQDSKITFLENRVDELEGMINDYWEDLKSTEDRVDILEESVDELQEQADS